jgi:hypothetical protein
VDEPTFLQLGSGWTEWHRRATLTATSWLARDVALT